MSKQRCLLLLFTTCITLALVALFASQTGYLPQPQSFTKVIDSLKGETKAPSNATTSATPHKPSHNLTDDLDVDADPTTQLLEQDPKGKFTLIAPGIILGYDRTDVTSPDDTHMLRLEGDGNLVLHRRGLGEKSRRLWWTGTGNFQPRFRYVMKFDEDGIVRIAALIKNNGKVDERVVWHSNFLPQCANATMPTDSPPRLMISNTGEIAIRGRCTLFAPPTSVGNMALLISGLYRTNNKTCESHMKHIVKNPAVKSADIFIHFLYEPHMVNDKVTPEVIEKDIRRCYGPNLRDLVFRPVAEVHEPFPGEVISTCGNKLHRLQSQLKTVAVGAERWWNYTIANGVKYDTVMRIRADHEWYGDRKPKFRDVDELAGNEIVLPDNWHNEGLKYWYCPTPFGEVNVGTLLCFLLNPRISLIWL